jgi:lysophospholipase L1-like esterase
LSFGSYTSPGVLVAYRFDTLDWQFTNVTANATHQFIAPSSQTQGTELYNLTTTATARTFELRVTNWAFGVQIERIHLSPNGTLFKPPTYSRNIEIVGDSLTAGQYATYESLSSWAWSLCSSLGTEFTISAYPGNCLVDTECWGNPRGQSHQWFQTRDTSWRAREAPGPDVPWDFKSHQSADLVIIHLGTNDNNTHNNVTATIFKDTYIEFVQKIHEIWPKSQVILVSLANGFYLDRSTYRWHQNGAFVEEILAVYNTFEKEAWVHYFNATGVWAHNDINPQWHYTDAGHIKLSSALMQYIRTKFGWEVEEAASGPEVLSGEFVLPCLFSPVC